MSSHHVNSALQYIVKQGELEMIMFVQRIRGASDKFDIFDNERPLQLAVSLGRLDMVKFLLNVLPLSLCTNTMERCQKLALTLA